MTRSKRKNIILIAVIAVVVIAAIAFGVNASLTKSAAAGKEPVADYTVTAGERTAIRDLIGFDEDGTALVDTEVVYLGDNSVVAVENGGFTPERAGTYKITLVKIKDGASVSSYYYVGAVASDSAVVKKEPAFPYAFVSGETYALKAPDARLYGADGTVKAAEYTVKATINGADVEIKSGKITPKVTRSGDKAVVEYTVKGKTGASDKVLRYEIPVVITRASDGVLDMTQVFVTEKIDEVKTEDSYLAAYTSTTGSTMKFCNPIPADNFRLRWKTVEGRINFDSFVVCLEDYENPSERVEIAYSSGGTGGAKVSVCGGKAYTVKPRFEAGSFTLEYSAIKKSISDENGIIAYVSRFADGREFTGFGSGIVKLSVRFGEVSAYSSVSFSHFGNQPLAGVRKDSISPYIFFEEEVRVCYEQGDTIKINKAIAYDVLDPAATVTVSVYKINDDDSVSAEIPTDDNGVPLRNYDCSEDVYIKVNDICRYRVEYTAKDWANRKNPVAYVYTVADNQSPVVDFGTMVTSAKVGSAVSLPSVTYDDNNGKEGVSVLYTYLTPSNVLEVVKGSNAFTVTEKGRYKVKIMVYDSQYNYVYKEYAVEVTE